MTALPTFREDDSNLVLPMPSVSDSMREIVRFWEGSDPQTHKREVSCTLRTAFSRLSDWNAVFLTIARAVVHDMNIGREPMSAEEIDETVFHFLGEIVDKLGEEGNYLPLSELEAAATPPQPVTTPALQPETPTNGHPGALAIPVEIFQDSAWRQMISIWYLPPVESCTGCGDDHDENLILTGDSKIMSHEKFGNLLANMARAHAGGTTETELERLKAEGAIEGTFLEVMHAGMTKQ